MFEVLAPITVGSAMVLLIDFARRVFPSITTRQLKYLTVILAVIYSTVIYFAQGNEKIEQMVQIFFVVLGTSQSLFSLVWKDSTIRQSIIKVGEQIETTSSIG